MSAFVCFVSTEIHNTSKFIYDISSTALLCVLWKDQKLGQIIEQDIIDAQQYTVLRGTPNATCDNMRIDYYYSKGYRIGPPGIINQLGGFWKDSYSLSGFVANKYIISLREEANALLSLLMMV